jgi:Smg protein
MLQVLLYLFDHHLVNEKVFSEDLVEVQQQLIAEDFPPQEIQQALSWLKELQYQRKEALMFRDFAPDSMRIWLPEEQYKLSADGLDFLLKLESQGVITAQLREVIIDRAMALNTPMVDIYQLKWVSLIVLYHYQQDDISIPWLEHVLLNESLNAH